MMELVQIIFESVILLVGLYLAFFKSYFQEKGKNIATKEDIQEITELVENVKQQIHYSIQSKLSLRAEERNALVNFYEVYNLWLHTIFDIRFADFNTSNRTKLTELEYRLYDAKFKFEIAQGRKDIFVNNDDIDSLSKKLKKMTFNLQSCVSEAITDLERLLNQKEHISNLGVNDYNNHYKELLEKKKAVFARINKELITGYKEIAPLDKQLKGLIYYHLQQIINEDGDE